MLREERRHREEKSSVLLNVLTLCLWFFPGVLISEPTTSDGRFQRSAKHISRRALGRIFAVTYKGNELAALSVGIIAIAAVGLWVGTYNSNIQTHTGIYIRVDSGDVCICL